MIAVKQAIHIKKNLRVVSFFFFYESKRENKMDKIHTKRMIRNRIIRKPVAVIRVKSTEQKSLYSKTKKLKLTFSESDSS